MKVYPKYKPSGIEWIGNIPEHWKLSRAKFVSTIFIPQRNKPDLNSEKGFPWLTMEDMLSNRIFKTSLRVNEESAQKAGSKILKKGSVIASCVGSFEVCAINEVDLIINQQLQAFIPNNILPEYLHAIVGISNDYFKMIATESTVVYVNQSGFANMPVLMIPISEQQQIVDFLDYKTGQCDRFIANRQKQIELLNEQKATVINKGVTKGFKQNVKFKKSETSTLDYYPENWILTKIKYLLERQKGAIKTGPFGTQLKNSDLVENGDVKIYNQRSIINKDFVGGNEYISLDKFNTLREFVIYPHDLLITTRGTIGKCAIFPSNAKMGVLHPCLIRLQLNQKKILNKYMMLCIENALFFQEEIKLLSNSTVIEVIYSYNLKEVFIPLPPIEEQQEILRCIKKETSKIETLIAKYQKQIDLMQEYRTALISQAVTGKIDVRDWQLPHN